METELRSTGPRSAGRCGLWPLILLTGLTGAAASAAAEELPAPGPPAADAPAQRPQGSAIEARLEQERVVRKTRFGILPHKPNYLLPLTYNQNPNSPSGEPLDHAEVKYQLSLKVPIGRPLFGDDGQVWFAYTQQSYWQAYNQDISAAFRETNYEPELMLTFGNDVSLWGFENRIITLGFVHQSNGEDVPLSRSWNRLYASFVFQRRNLYLGIRPWWRIPESDKDDPLSPHGDDNPDIENYAGRADITAVYLAGRHHLGLQLRHNLRIEHARAGLQLDWSFPAGRNLRLYLQYYNGYGESLIDYDHYTNRIGLGVMVTDWL